MRLRTRCTFACCLLLASACETAGGGQRPLHYGLALGRQVVTGELFTETLDETRELEDVAVTAGFGEVVFDGDVAFHARLLWSHSSHRIENTVDNASIVQVLGFGMISKTLQLFDGVAFRPLFGVGAGSTTIDLPAELGPELSDAAAAIAGGVEMELVGHATIGAMFWSSVIGTPGDTQAELGNAMVYAGVRF